MQDDQDAYMFNPLGTNDLSFSRWSSTNLLIVIVSPLGYISGFYMKEHIGEQHLRISCRYKVGFDMLQEFCNVKCIQKSIHNNNTIGVQY